MYDSVVFEIIRNIKPSPRGEYEITEVNNEYIRRGQLAYEILEGDWTDAGTFESLLYANQMLAKTREPNESLNLVSENQIADMVKIYEDKIEELKRYPKNNNGKK